MNGSHCPFVNLVIDRLVNGLYTSHLVTAGIRSSSSPPTPALHPINRDGARKIYRTKTEDELRGLF